MSLNLDTINDNLRALLALLYGVDINTVRPANNDGPTGLVTDEFITVLLNESVDEGQDEVVLSANADPTLVTETVRGPRHLTASVQFFRGTALSKAARLGSILRLTKATQGLQAAGLGLIRVGRETNLTQVVDTYYESRAQVEVEFYCISEEQASVATYRTFDVSVDNAKKVTTSEVIQP